VHERMHMKERDRKVVNYYSEKEEALNIWSHAMGIVFGVVGLILLIAKGWGNGWEIFSFSVFGVSIILLYTASTSYHRAKDMELRGKLKVLDHSSIYVLIAGTYTPFTLLVLPSPTGWMLFAAVWSIALFGIILKQFFTGRLNLLSTSLYIVMGWLIVFVWEPLSQVFPMAGFLWLLAGGILYTVGAVIYMFKKLPFAHAIFHFFVLGATVCQFIAVYRYF
jgi:hemolysin III